MGFAKRAWGEEQARDYHTSDDAVCAECFNDSGIREFIDDHVELTKCSICGRTSKEPIACPADELLEFFLEKVQKHYQNVDGNAPFDKENWEYMVSTWNMHDLVYDEFGDIGNYETLEWLYKHLKDDITYCKQDWQIMSSGEALRSGWERFCEAVKHETRFLFFASQTAEDDGEPFSVHPAEMLSELGDAIRRCGLIRTIPVGTRIFRVRGHEAGKSYSEPVDVGPPPQKCAKTAGRMNAPGIVVMYASFERSAALTEATSNHANFTVAEFELLKNFLVVDLTDIPPVPSIFEGGLRESLQFLRSFAKEVSKPFTPDDKIHVEYTPTQVVCEYLRHRLTGPKGDPIRGLIYGSAKERGSANLALFVESEEVEGVPKEAWRRKESVLRLVAVEEVEKASALAIE